jgi:hypothetical protein
VAPVAVKAVSFPTSQKEISSALEAEISEPVALVQQSGGTVAFPFEILRQGQKVDPSQIVVTSIQPLSPTRYRITFAAGSKYPIPGDSLRLAEGAAVDAKGNPSGKAVYIPVGGTSARVLADLSVNLEKGVLEGPAINRSPSLNPVVVHGQKICLNCSDPGVRELLPLSDPARLSDLGPTWIVKSKYPFRYSLAFFDNLGQFINRAQGEVNPSQFQALRATQSPDDSVAVKLTFLPISRDGRALGTGAYIMKGTLQLQNQEGLKGTQGETVTLAPSERTLVSRFGYVRKK